MLVKNKKRDFIKVLKYIEIEKGKKLDEIETYYKFYKDVEQIKIDSLNKINKICLTKIR